MNMDPSYLFLLTSESNKQNFSQIVIFLPNTNSRVNFKCHQSSATTRFFSLFCFVFFGPVTKQTVRLLFFYSTSSYTEEL